MVQLKNILSFSRKLSVILIVWESIHSMDQQNLCRKGVKSKKINAFRLNQQFEQELNCKWRQQYQWIRVIKHQCIAIKNSPSAKGDLIIK